MPLPILTTSKASGGLKGIRDRLFGQKTSEPNSQTVNEPSTREAPIPVKTPSSSTLRPFTRRAAVAGGTPNNFADSSIARNRDANAKAIAASQGSGVNPLIPLIQNVNHSLIRYR